MGKLYIKTIIPVSGEAYAGFLSDRDNEILIRISPIVAWALVGSVDCDRQEAVVGQIIATDSIELITNLGVRDGFGKFVGYFHSEEWFRARIDVLEFEKSRDERKRCLGDGDDEDNDQESE